MHSLLLENHNALIKDLAQGLWITGGSLEDTHTPCYLLFYHRVKCMN